MRPLVTAGFVLLMTVVLGGCGRDEGETYGAVPSPSGSMTAIKQEKGEEHTSWDVFLVDHAGGHDHKIALLTDQPLDYGVYGTDGVVMAWEDDHHLTIGWPNGFRAVKGPSRIEDVDIRYRPFEADIDKVHAARSETVSLQNGAVRFREIDGTYGGAYYTATGKPVPHIQCIIEVSGSEDAATTVSAQIIGNGIGHSNDPYPIYGGIKVKFTRWSHNAAEDSMLTLAQWGSHTSERPRTFVRQSTGSLEYARLSADDVFEFAKEIQGRVVTLKYMLDFDRSSKFYNLNISGDVNSIYSQFEECISKTNIGFPRNFDLPMRIE